MLKGDGFGKNLAVNRVTILIILELSLNQKEEQL